MRELKKEKECILNKRKELDNELNLWRENVERLSKSLIQLENQIQEGQIHRHRVINLFFINVEYFSI